MGCRSVSFIPAGPLHNTSLQFTLMFYVLPLGMAIGVGLVLRAFPSLWAQTVRGTDASRNHTMDGARGLLTLWVLTYHTDLVPWIVQTAEHWRLPPGRLSTLMDSGFFVAPFFALTGLLFGSSLLANQGKLATRQFLRRRFFRIVPGYVVSVVLLLSAAAWISGFQLKVAPLKLLYELTRWSLFGFVARYDINGVDLERAHGMLWTLPYEISFYLLVPVLALGMRRIGKAGAPLFLFGALVLIGAIWWPFLFFASGIVAAALVGWQHSRADSILQWSSVGAVALLALTVYYTSAVLQALLLAPILAAMAREAPMFRLLRIRPLRYVGEISYSVYILHYPILWVIFLAVGGPGPLSTAGPVERWGMLIGCGLFILAASTLCYIFVERPFIGLGRALERRAEQTIAPAVWDGDALEGRS